MVWHRPQRLLPPKLVAALDAAHAGDAAGALRLLEKQPGVDALTAETARLVRGLAAAETADGEKAQRVLQPLMRASDPDIALAATLACVEIQMARRGFARAAPWLRRAWRHAQDEPTALVLEAALLRLQMRRGGPVKTTEVERLHSHLKRQHPAAVHATVQLLTAEHALYSGALAVSTRAERAARACVDASRLAALRRWHESLRALLQDSPVALVDDWKRPRRTLRRTELADLQLESWQLWADSRHQKLAITGAKAGQPETFHFAHAEDAWRVLRALLEAHDLRLSWKNLQAVLGAPDRTGAEERVDALRRHLGEHCRWLRKSSTGCALAVQRFVHLLPPPDLPSQHQRLLALLAERPGTTGHDLSTAMGSPQRTVRRHLQQLRSLGLALIVGGGRDARYWAI